MGHYISIRGWVGCSQEQVPQVRTIMKSFVDRAKEYGLTREGAEMYNKGWTIPSEHINWTFYFFYGADIRIQYTEFIRDQIIAMTNEIVRYDEEFTDYINGIFDLEDDEGEVFLTWKTKEGEFFEIDNERYRFFELEHYKTFQTEPGMILESTVIQFRNTFHLKACGPDKYKAAFSNYEGLRWKDIVRFKVLSVDHDQQLMKGEFIEIVGRS